MLVERPTTRGCRIQPIAECPAPALSRITTTSYFIGANNSLFMPILNSLMEAAASIVGLLAVGAKVYGSLEYFISTAIDAPLSAITLCDEVRDFRFALERLKPYVDSGNMCGHILATGEEDGSYHRSVRPDDDFRSPQMVIRRI